MELVDYTPKERISVKIYREEYEYITSTITKYNDTFADALKRLLSGTSQGDHRSNEMTAKEVKSV